MSDEVAKLRRRVRQLESSRQKWKSRVADKQHTIRYLRVKARDLALSRDRWKGLASSTVRANPPPPPPAPVLLPLHCVTHTTPEAPSLGEP